MSIKRELKTAILEYAVENEDEILESFTDDLVSDAVVEIKREFEGHPLQDQIVKAVELFDYESDLAEEFTSAIRSIESDAGLR